MRVGNKRGGVKSARSEHWSRALRVPAPRVIVRGHEVS